MAGARRLDWMVDDGADEVEWPDRPDVSGAAKGDDFEASIAISMMFSCAWRLMRMM